MSSLALDAPSRVDELGLAAGDAEVFSRVATNGQATFGARRPCVRDLRAKDQFPTSLKPTVC